MRVRAVCWALAVATVCAGTAAGQVPPAPVQVARVANQHSMSATEVAVSAPLPVSAAPIGKIATADLNAWLDGYLPAALKAHDIAGAVVAVVKDGKVVTARGYGYADVARRKPVDPALTLFRPGSTSKLVTWTAVMQQVEAGRLDLDRDVNAYLDFKIPPRHGKPVTLRQIMTHTGGFEEVMRDTVFYDGKRLLTLGAYLKRRVPARIFDAGTTPDYSNWATALAGYIVQRVSGVPFDDYVKRRIFNPLGMRTATFRQPLPPALRGLAATGYQRASDPPRGYEFVGPAPAGSMSASGLDMAKFMIAHLENGRGIMSPRTAATMHDGPLGRVNPASLIPPLNRMRLGFFETNLNGREIIGHLGDTNDFHTSLHLFMAEHVGLYVSFNSAGRDGAAGILRLRLFQDFADRYFPAPDRDHRLDAPTAASHAASMAGRWEVSRREVSGVGDILNLVGAMQVTTDGHGALVTLGFKDLNGVPRTWDEIAPWVWRDRGGHDRLAAIVVDGKPVRWTFDLVSPFMVWEPYPAWRSPTWLLPALYISLAVLLLTLLYWPAAWFVRRRFGAPLAVVGRARQAYRATRITSALALLVLAGWAVLIGPILGSEATPLLGAGGWLWLLQITGALAFVGLVALAAWNAWLTWRDGRRWTRRLWSLLVLVAALVLLFTAATYGLLAMTVDY